MMGDKITTHKGAQLIMTPVSSGVEPCSAACSEIEHACTHTRSIHTAAEIYTPVLNLGTKPSVEDISKQQIKYVES